MRRSIESYVMAGQGFHFVNGSLTYTQRVLYVICVITTGCKLIEQVQWPIRAWPFGAHVCSEQVDCLALRIAAWGTVGRACLFRTHACSERACCLALGSAAVLSRTAHHSLEEENSSVATLVYPTPGKGMLSMTWKCCVYQFRHCTSLGPEEYTRQV